MAITTRAGLLGAPRRVIRTATPSTTFQGNSASMLGALYSLWTLANKPGGAGAAPGTAGAQPTAATLGALPIVNAGGSNTLYLADWWLSLSPLDTRSGLLLLYDRLSANGGFDGNSTTLNTFSTPLTIGRGDTTGEGVMAFVEVYATIGNTASTLSIGYTASDGTTGRTGTVLWGPSSHAAGFGCLMKLQGGDRGVKAVQSSQWSVGTGAVGSYGITLARRIAEIPYLGTRRPHRTMRDAMALCLKKIDADACLALAWQRAGAISGGSSNFGATLGFVEG